VNRRLLLAGLAGFVLRGLVTGAVLAYVWRRDGWYPECGRPADGPAAWGRTWR
jgi:hypothetical protein